MIATLFARFVVAIFAVVIAPFLLIVVLALFTYQAARGALNWIDLHAFYAGDRDAQERDHWRSS